MGFRVVSTNGAAVKPIWALVRYGGIFVSAVLLLGAGFLPIAFDRRRRGLQDFLARTVAIETPDPRHDSGWSGPAPPIPPPARRARGGDGGGMLERSSDAGDDGTEPAREGPLA